MINANFSATTNCLLKKASLGSTSASLSRTRLSTPGVFQQPVSPARHRGMTLIEILVTLVIVAIIAAVAIPSYQSSVVKSNRGVGKSELMQLVSRQEQYFVNNKVYATDLTDLGYPANGFYITRSGEAVTSASGGVYRIELASGATTSSFTAQAIPVGAQVDDSNCGTLTISDTGTQSATGSTGSACWQ